MNVEHVMVFPTVISKSSIDITDADKEIIYDVVKNNLNDQNYTMDYLGYTEIHHEVALEKFYKQIIVALREHFAHLQIDESKLEINVVKSWLNLTETRVNTSHNHAEAHYSFTFYANVPEHTKKYLRFYRTEAHPNEIYRGFFENVCNNWEMQNSMTCSFMPEEGDIYIFPASLMHDTTFHSPTEESGLERVKDDEHLRNMRICIGGDVIITSKDKTNNHRMLQPVNSWKTFD